ncbi:unnamed protein product [Dicrocoelium dendriticum]|nr:unnamed protein product [Dicrocoelium dendriticum]
MRAYHLNLFKPFSALSTSTVSFDMSVALKRPAPPEEACPTSTKIPQLEFDPSTRCKKKMHALLLMYCGWDYYGMQRSPTHPTVEGELSKALLACSYLDDLSAEAYRKVWFQRASKTDKAVSATGQVCSMLLPDNDEVASKLNSVLPEHIRILDVIRTTRCFAAHSLCSHRIYDYLFPTFVLAPYDLPLVDTLHRSYRVAPERLTHVNAVLSRYKGTHNFYNFTSRRLPTDRSCRRFIVSIECLPPFLICESEYAVIRIVGQSFMLHQIRKMIGLMFAVVRGNMDDNVFDIVFGTERVDIPRAPALGLMLNQVVYSRYNERYGRDGIHKPIEWANYEEQMSNFKVTHIYDHVHKTESNEGSMLSWLYSLNERTFLFRDSSNRILDCSSIHPNEDSSESDENDTALLAS